MYDTFYSISKHTAAYLMFVTTRFLIDLFFKEFVGQIFEVLSICTKLETDTKVSDFRKLWLDFCKRIYIQKISFIGRFIYPSDV